MQNVIVIVALRVLGACLDTWIVEVLLLRAALTIRIQAE